MPISKENSKIEKFFADYPSRKYKAGDLLFDPENPATGIYFLESGIVRVYSLNKNGKETTINIFKPISFFPAQIIFLKKPDKYYYQAITEASVRVSPVKHFEKLLKKNNDLLVSLLERIYRGLDGYMKRIEALTSNDPYFNTLIHLLIYCQRFPVGGTDFVIKQEEIAAETGLSRETVTRNVAKLKNKGIVKYINRKLTVPDIQLLEKEIQIY